MLLSLSSVGTPEVGTLTGAKIQRPSHPSGSQNLWIRPHVELSNCFGVIGTKGEVGGRLFRE